MENKDRYDDLGSQIMRDHDRMVADRSVLDSHCEEIASRVLPSMKNMFTGRGGSIHVKGEKNTEEMFDSTASTALDRFAAATESMLTPRTQKWHRLRATNPELNRSQRVREWFDMARDILFKHRYSPRAAFASNNHEVFVSTGAFGTGALWVDRRKPGHGEIAAGIRYKAIPLSEVHFRENHEGIIDVAHRTRWLTARQAHQMFETEYLPEKIVAIMEKESSGNPDQLFEFVHCIQPREDYNPMRMDRKGMPFASYYVSRDNKRLQVIKGEQDPEGGYRRLPVIPARYVTAPGELYGRSPAMMALPNIKVLNEEKKTFLKVGHRLADPVILGHDDGVLDMMSLKPGALVPGGIDSQGRKLIQALDAPAGQMGALEKLMEAERIPINDAFLVSLFQILVETPQMTATEVLERAREKGALLAPTMGRLQSEYLGPMIERELDILAAEGLLPPMPPELIEARGEYDIEYDSPLSRSMRAEEASGFMRTLEMATQYAAATSDPSPLDWFDFDKAMPELADIQAVPAGWMRDQEAVDARRQGRIQTQQQQQLVNAMPGGAAMIKALNETSKQGG